jgi:tetratricopeptide (TPR) repeat protein
MTLEAEREFLLQSLADLETERDAGNIDDETYRTLHDDYTARAAAVIRTIDDGVERPLPDAPRGPSWLRIATICGVVVFAIAAGVALTRALGTRDPGETITGNQENEADPLEFLAQTAAENPDDYDARIEYARALLGEDPPAALEEFGAAGAIDPSQPEPPTYMGWITGLAAGGLEASPERDDLVTSSLSYLDHAIELDPEFADAYVYRALVNMQVAGDTEAAVPDFQRWLTLAPTDHPMREMVLGALAEALPDTVTTP